MNIPCFTKLQPVMFLTNYQHLKQSSSLDMLGINIYTHVQSSHRTTIVCTLQICRIIS